MARQMKTVKSCNLAIKLKLKYEKGDQLKYPFSHYKKPSIKDVRTKPRKIVRVAVWIYHKFQKIRSFLHQKVRMFTSEKPPFLLFALDKPPSHVTADVFYEQSLNFL